MPHTDVKPTYHVTLTADEFRLVTMALAGMLVDQDDIELALELNVHLCHQRMQMLKDATVKADKALESAKNKLDECEGDE